ncbi:MAG: universal stress protein [Bacteroidetes bacterium]|nr:universal stress protein [Bacteroidota bacterium]
MKSLTERIITVGSFPYSRAMLLQIQLQTEGIDCFLVSKESLQPVRTADLRVKQAQVAKALKIIDESIHFSGLAKEKAVKTLGVVRRILVPVDFSNLSTHACRFAISLAQKYKAEVKLLHVYYNPAIDITPYDDHYSYQVKLSDNLREIEKNARLSMVKLDQKLTTWCKLEHIQDVRISTGLVNGESADEILEYSKKYRPALIIMGTRGLTKGTHPMGRVTTKVTENALVPVLALPVSSANKVGDLKNLLYATDFDPSDYSAINRLLHLMSPLGITLHCVHVSVGMKKPWDPVKMDELKQHLIHEYGDTSVKFDLIVSDNVVNSIETYIRNNDIDAIALITRKRGTLEKMFAPSYTKKIFTEIGKPLFVFHASA